MTQPNFRAETVAELLDVINQLLHEGKVKPEDTWFGYDDGTLCFGKFGTPELIDISPYTEI